MVGNKCLLLVGYSILGALCSEFTITMPKNIQALSGSCVLIPCTFNIPKDYEDQLKNSAGGVWIKTVPQYAWPNAIVVFNSSAIHNILSGEIVGDLVQKNCTTVLDKITERYKDDYYFRIETTSYKATFRDTPVYIDVTGSPQKPEISTPKELNEGTQVHLECTAAAPCNKHPPVLAWTPNIGNTGHKERLQENPNEIKSVLSVLTFTPSHIHHGKSITCSAEYTLQTGGKINVAENITLNVLFPPKNTKASMSPSGPLVNSNHVTLTCTSSANPPVNNYAWFRTTGSLVTKRATGQTLSFNVSSNDAGWYHCEAHNQRGKQKSAQVELTIGDVRGTSSPVVIGAVAGTLGVLSACLLALLFWRLRKSRESCVSKNRGQIPSSVCMDEPVRTINTPAEFLQSQQPLSEVVTLKMRSVATLVPNYGPVKDNPTFNPSKAVNTRETTKFSESQNEEVQYAEISNLGAKEKGKRDKEDRRGQETEYSEVRFQERKGKAPVEDIYAKVIKPKHRPEA